MTVPAMSSLRWRARLGGGLAATATVAVAVAHHDRHSPAARVDWRP